MTWRWWLLAWGETSHRPGFTTKKMNKWFSKSILVPFALRADKFWEKNRVSPWTSVSPDFRGWRILRFYQVNWGWDEELKLRSFYQTYKSLDKPRATVSSSRKFCL
jgi:hypothetical protein